MDRKEEFLKPGERLDDLQNGYWMIQNPSLFCYGIDAVLLASYAKVKRGERAMDFCTGSGIVPILLKAKTNGEHFSGLEIQEYSAEMAQRSVRYNHLENDVEIFQGDVKTASQQFGKEVFDVVTCNPPYMTGQHGLTNALEAKTIARHEVLCSFDDIAKEASAVLKTKGRFYLVHRPLRAVLRERAGGGDFFDAEKISSGTKKDAARLSVCGQGAEHGADRGDERRESENYRGETADCV